MRQGKSQAKLVVGIVANDPSKFNAILNDPENQYWFQLTPGKVLSKREISSSDLMSLTFIQSSTTGVFYTGELLSPASVGCVADTSTTMTTSPSIARRT